MKTIALIITLSITNLYAVQMASFEGRDARKIYQLLQKTNPSQYTGQNGALSLEDRPSVCSGRLCHVDYQIKGKRSLIEKQCYDKENCTLTSTFDALQCKIGNKMVPIFECRATSTYANQRLSTVLHGQSDNPLLLVAKTIVNRYELKNCLPSQKYCFGEVEMSRIECRKEKVNFIHTDFECEIEFQ